MNPWDRAGQSLCVVGQDLFMDSLQVFKNCPASELLAFPLCTSLLRCPGMQLVGVSGETYGLILFFA